MRIQSKSFKLVAAFIVVVLLSAGCSRKSYYAERLKLPALPPVQALAPADTPMANPEDGKLEDSIRTALSPSQADGVVSQIRMANSFMGLATENAQVLEQIKIRIAYAEQAAQIKRAQLEDGDSSDSTGEVEERLKSARQCAVNAQELRKKFPSPTPALPGFGR